MTYTVLFILYTHKRNVEEKKCVKTRKGRQSSVALAKKLYVSIDNRGGWALPVLFRVVDASKSPCRNSVAQNLGGSACL